MKHIYYYKGRLIRASSRLEALNFATPTHEKPVIPTQDELLDLIGKGVKVENAKPEQGEAQLEAKV